MKNYIIWVVGATIALISGLTAMGAISKNKAPEIATTLYPVNGFAAENLAAASIKDSIAENMGQFPDHVSSLTTRLARQSFISEPITPKAVTVLALGSAKNSKRKLMNDAWVLSRRQPLITGWMIVDTGARGDVPALLNHYDAMLRTSTSAASVVLPVMAGALANDDFVAPLAKLLAKQPPWASKFWGAVVATPASLGNAVRLREALFKPNENDDAYRDANLIRALVKNKQFGQARNLYSILVNSKESGSLIENSSFNTESKYPPIDWQLFSNGEYGAVITGGKLQLSAIRNAGGIFARQLIKLPAQTLTMDANTSNASSVDSQIFVSLTCAQATENAPRTIRMPLKRSIKKLQIDNSNSRCSFYWLDISGRSSENGDGFDLALDSIFIQPRVN